MQRDEVRRATIRRAWTRAPPAAHTPAVQRTPLTPEELERRRPVWSALSDLFLDTEVRPAHPWRARVCARSGLDLPALRAIFDDELHPLLYSNLLSIAGEWGGFDEAWLESAIVSRRARPVLAGLFDLPSRALAGTAGKEAGRSDLEAVLALLPAARALEAGPPEAAERWSATLECLAWFYLDARPASWTHERAVRLGATADEARLLADLHLEGVFEPLRVDGHDVTRAAGWAAVRQLLNTWAA